MQDDGPFDGGTFDKATLRREITIQMLKGGGVACAAVFGPIIFIYVIYLIGLLLPAESKEAVDPTPDSFSFYEVVVEDTARV